MYVTEQAAFLNAAVLARTDLPPLQLLYHCKQIEKQAGEAAVSCQCRECTQAETGEGLRTAMYCSCMACRQSAGSACDVHERGARVC